MAKVTIASVPTEHEATRQRCERLENETRIAEQNVALLRGFAMARLTATDLDALPPEFGDFLRGVGHVDTFTLSTGHRPYIRG